MLRRALLSLPLIVVGCSGGCGTTSAAPGSPDASGAPDALDGKDAVDDPAKTDAADAAEADAAHPDAKPEAGDGGYEPGPGPTDCGPFPTPSAVPPGWQEYTGWSCKCRLYFPTPTGEPPKSLQWEDCKPPLPTSGCLSLKPFWYLGEKTNFIAPTVNFSRDVNTGKPLLGFTPIFWEGNQYIGYHLIAEADGPVRAAVLEVDAGGCVTAIEALNTNRYLYYVVGDEWSGTAQGATAVGLLGGSIDDWLPQFV